MALSPVAAEAFYSPFGGPGLNYATTVNDINAPSVGALSQIGWVEVAVDSANPLGVNEHFKILGADNYLLAR